MARLIVIDASVAIAALARGDVHHEAAAAAIAGADEDELVIAATTRTEVLVGAIRRGGAALASTTGFLEGCVTVPVSAPIADRAATLRAGHPSLSVPDAITLAVADAIDADSVWSFDDRWRSVDRRVAHPGTAAQS